VFDSLDEALRALDRARLIGVALGLSALLVPLAALTLLARWRPPGGRGGRAALRTAGSVVALAYALLAASAAADWPFRVEGPARGRVARALGAPVVDALERHHAERGRYPESLDALVPAYLAADALVAPARSPLGRPFAYVRTGHHFVLRVAEAPPGVSECLFASAARRWYCNGYF
jgi:hypothetical protein